MNIEWWHWLVAGLALILFELAKRLEASLHRGIVSSPG